MAVERVVTVRWRCPGGHLHQDKAQAEKCGKAGETAATRRAKAAAYRAQQKHDREQRAQDERQAIREKLETDGLSTRAEAALKELQDYGYPQGLSYGERTKAEILRTRGVGRRTFVELEIWHEMGRI